MKTKSGNVNYADKILTFMSILVKNVVQRNKI